MNKAILPKVAKPIRYEVKLDIDLSNFKYTGSQDVELEIIKETKSFEVNAIDIEIISTLLFNEDGKEFDLTFEYLEDLERISFTASENIPVGNYSLQLEFNSTITNDLKGFYKSQFLDLNDNEKWIATTQFEPTSARNAFPCWDEPEYKAVFSISLTSDEKYLRVSNEKVLRENKLKDGRVETLFVDSMKMSTYLVAFVIGELEVTEVGSVDDTQIRIIHRPGFSHQTSFAGTAGMKILEFFENYYQIPYPGSKLDLIAIPDFAMGAMENVGAVTFRESLLLIDESKATRQELSRSVSVIAHELAHMWFGDLVTMKWWDGIWLNEAFASLMEAIAANGTYPEFDQWSEMNLSRSAGFGVDSLKNSRPVEFEVETPEQAEEMFDVLTYEKGSTVLRMFEMFVGEEVFQEGVQQYLNKYKFENTHSSDLWESLSEASKLPLNKMLPTWIKQPGFPIINVSKSGSKFILEQSKFLIDGSTDDSLWEIPVNVRFLDTGKVHTLVQNSKTIELDALGEIPFINNGGWAFYHVVYDAEIFTKIKENFNELNSLEKYRLLEDTWKSVTIGKFSINEFLEFLPIYKSERDPNIWAYIAGIISSLSKILPNDSNVSFVNYFNELIDSIKNDLGKEIKDSDSMEIKELRATVNKLIGTIENEESFVDFYSSKFKDGSIENIEDGSLYNTTLYVSALDPEIKIEHFLEKFLNAGSPQIEGRYRAILGVVRDPNAGKIIVQSMLDGTIRGADCPYILASMIANKVTGKDSWNEIKDNYSGLLGIMPEWTASRLLSGLDAIFDRELGDDIRSFIMANPLPSAEKLMAQKLEKLEANMNLVIHINSTLDESILEK
ncbi:M1 family metallopeptidase [Acidimicrobiia bacterium]|nr:M1 family metallopeptidase [Acidimicrobiia bacterium]